MGRNFVFGSVLIFFVFHAKSGTNNNWTGLSDISYSIPYGHDSNPFLRIHKFSQRGDFSSYFERIKRASKLILIV